MKRVGFVDDRPTPNQWSQKPIRNQEQKLKLIRSTIFGILFFGDHSHWKRPGESLAYFRRNLRWFRFPPMVLKVNGFKVTSW